MNKQIEFQKFMNIIKFVPNNKNSTVNYIFNKIIYDDTTQFVSFPNSFITYIIILIKK